MTYYVVIPAYNEQNTITNIIKKVKQLTNNIIVIDDGSKDDTYAKAKQENVTVLKHSVNLGKGAALKTGCDYAMQCGAEQVIVMDADGQHEPRDIPKFLEALKQVDIAFGTRKESKSMPFVLKFGNKFISTTLFILHKIKVADSQCGYRAFTAKTYEKIRWDATDYFLETEMLVKTGRNGLSYTQIPIETIYNDKYKGTTVLDGISIVTKILGGKIIK